MELFTAGSSFQQEVTSHLKQALSDQEILCRIRTYSSPAKRMQREQANARLWLQEDTAQHGADGERILGRR
ncbi:MAG: hypothetical protein CL862_10945 [Cyanobium sp. NAT70]|nr:hypothetical protein [Cyanobium sp. NAT70]